MGRVKAELQLPGVATSDAEELWYDTDRWPTFVDGFGHVHKVDDGWPRRPGAVVVWDGKTGGRGRVLERVVSFEARVGQTVEIEDDKIKRLTAYYDGTAFARSIIYFHPKIGSRLRRGDFNDVIVFRVMQRELGVRLRDIKHTIRAELASADDARVLDCAPRDPILSTQLVYRSDASLVVEVAYTRYPAREYSLTYSLTTQRAGIRRA